jgi:hypothetical protein
MLLTTREYARMQGVDERAARRMCETGRVPAVRMGGGCWLIQHDDEEEEDKDAHEADGRA